MELPRSTAADDVGFSLETLARFYADVRDKTARALASVNGEADRLDVPNLAASLVPPYRDEVRALGHLLVGHPLDEREARKVIHDHASACILRDISSLPG